MLWMICRLPFFSSETTGGWDGKGNTFLFLLLHLVLRYLLIYGEQVIADWDECLCCKNYGLCLLTQLQIFHLFLKSSTGWSNFQLQLFPTRGAHFPPLVPFMGILWRKCMIKPNHKVWLLHLRLFYISQICISNQGEGDQFWLRIRRD